MSVSRERLHDEWLALRCQAGEAEAFAELIGEMERPLLYFAERLVGNAETALDVLQDVWLRAFRGIRRLKQPRRLRAWLYRTTRHVAVDHVRRDVSRRRREQNAAISEDDGGGGDSFARESAEQLHRALGELDWIHREVLVLHFLEDLSTQEVAEVIDCPQGTVKSRLHHAKRALRAKLESKKNHEQ